MNDNIDNDMRDLLVATINPDNTVTLSDPDTGSVPVGMSYGDVEIIGTDGTSIIVDGGDHPVIYTMTAPNKLEAFLVGREWVVTDTDIISAFAAKRTDSPLGLIIVTIDGERIKLEDIMGIPCLRS